jgi:hypothetical protein
LRTRSATSIGRSISALWAFRTCTTNQWPLCDSSMTRVPAVTFTGARNGSPSGARGIGAMVNGYTAGGFGAILVGLLIAGFIAWFLRLPVRGAGSSGTGAVLVPSPVCPAAMSRALYDGLHY